MASGRRVDLTGWNRIGRCYNLHGVAALWFRGLVPPHSLLISLARTQPPPETHRLKPTGAQFGCFRSAPTERGSTVGMAQAQAGDELMEGGALTFGWPVGAVDQPVEGEACEGGE